MATDEDHPSPVLVRLESTEELKEKTTPFLYLPYPFTKILTKLLQLSQSKLKLHVEKQLHCTLHGLFHLDTYLA